MDSKERIRKQVHRLLNELKSTELFNSIEEYDKYRKDCDCTDCRSYFSTKEPQ